MMATKRLCATPNAPLLLSIDCLPDAVLSAMFGFLPWRVKVTVLNLVSTRWRTTQAAWPRLFIGHGDDDEDENDYAVEDDVTNEQLFTILSAAQPQTLRTFGTDFDDPRLVIFMLRHAVNLTSFRTGGLNRETLLALITALREREARRRGQDSCADELISLSLTLEDQSDPDYLLFLQLLSFTCVRRLKLCDFKGSLPDWMQTLGLSWSVQHLDLSFNTRAVENLDFVKHLPTLRVLELYSCLNVQDTHVISLTRHAPQLEKLFVGSCSLLTDASVSFILRHLVHLKHLDISDTKVTKVSYPSSSLTSLDCSYLDLKLPLCMSALTQLETVDLSRTCLEDDDLSCLRGLSKLKDLMLRLNDKLVGPGFAHLNPLALRSLDLGACSGLKDFSYLYQPSLEHLNLERVSLQDTNFFSCLNRIPRLRRLDIKNTDIRDADLTALHVLGNLTAIDLSSCKSVTCSGGLNLWAALQNQSKQKVYVQLEG
jgi:uncharacterized protein YjbI with pentapeptide repeats